MSRHVRCHPAVWIVLCAGILAGGSCVGGTGELNDNGGNRAVSARNDSYSLDLENRTLVHEIRPELAEVEKQKFVEITITEVFNPSDIPLSFEVRFRPRNAEEVLLGVFSLFPPHKPGTFIVATQGRVRSGGAIVVSMLVLEEVGPQDQVRVILDRISFRNE